MVGFLTRRQALRRGFLGGGALALAACGGVVGSVSRASPAPLLGFYWNTPLDPAVQSALEQGLQVAFPSVRLEQGMIPPGSTIDWWLVVDRAITGQATDLGEGLRQINFDPTVLVPGAYGAFYQNGARLALPVGLMPFAVEYAPEALVAAGLQPPAPDWTFDDFLTVCDRLDTAIRAGRLASLGVDQVLYPLLAQPIMRNDQFNTKDGPYWWQNTVGLTTPALLEAFVRGYGGTVVDDGQVRWDQGAAQDGLMALFGMAARFGNGPLPDITTSTAADAAWNRAALRLIQIQEFDVVPRGSGRIAGLAAFPRLPATPVLPVKAVPCWLAYGPDPNSGRIVPPSAGGQLAEAEVIAARFFAWFYQDPQQRLVAADGLAPVTTTGGALAGYWSQLGIGDPSRPPLFPFAWPAAAADVLRLALPGIARQAIGHPDALPGALAALGTQLTAALAQASDPD